MQDSFTFEGLDEIAAGLQASADEIGYLVILDRSASPEKPISRFNFDGDGLRAWQAESGEESADLDDEDDAGQPSPGELANGALRWVRASAQRATAGDASRRFRLLAWSPKGVSRVFSRCFVCKNARPRRPVPAPISLGDLQIPDTRGAAPRFDEIANYQALPAFKALSEFYMQFGHMLFTGVAQLQSVQDSVVGRLSQELHSSREQVDQLLAALLKFRFQDAKQSAEEREKTRDSEAISGLAEQAVGQIGLAVQTLLLTRGLNTETIEMIGTLGASPELMSTLRDPSVLVLVKNPANLQILAGMLRQIADQPTMDLPALEGDRKPSN